MITKDLSFFILSITMIISAGLFMFTQLKPPVQSEEVVFLEENVTKSEMLDILKEKGLLKNNFTYKTLSFLATVFEKDKQIQSGGYVFHGNLTASAISGSLEDPEYKYVAVIEGMRKEEIAERVGDALGWEENKIKTFKGKYPVCSFVGREGYLAPGDYLIKKDSDIQEIQERMEERFSQKLSDIEINGAETDLDKIITIASLIQRESGGKRDMRLISGIIWNRLELGMPLQIDATLQYVKGEDGLWWPQVNAGDKYIESPFNTYTNDGLPPQPIANPGSAAIAAAANPLDTSCLFYLHDKSGTIHCSSDYEGHKANIKRYLQ